jgi:hypothetical protein
VSFSAVILRSEPCGALAPLGELRRMGHRRRTLILRGSPKRLAPPATTAKPLRGDDGGAVG